MKIVVASNETQWTDKSIEQLVRVATRHGNRGKMPDYCVVNVLKTTKPEGKVTFLNTSSELVLEIPESTPLRQLANASRRRSTLDPGVTVSLVERIGRALPGVSCWPIAGEGIPTVVSRAKPQARKKFEDTPIGRAQAKVARAEARVGKYQGLLERAERDLRKAQGVLKRAETKHAPPQYGPSRERWLAS